MEALMSFIGKLKLQLPLGIRQSTIVNRRLSLCLEIITALTVLRAIQSQNLIIRKQTQSHHQIHNLNNNESHHYRKDPGGGDGNDLVQELAWVAVQQSVSRSRVN